MLQFDEATARVLDVAYLGADVSERRRANFDALSPRPDERILDLGCGNGLLTVELSRAVGPKGNVTGLDQSPDMLASARNRCAGMDNVDLVEGMADAQPFGDSRFDKAVSIQVFEYFDDMRPALRELHRVLRPGGRLVIGDIHWDTLAWFSDDPDRMGHMIRLWDDHLAQRDVPAHLPAQLRDCGFTVDTVRPHTICDTVLRPDGMANLLIRIMTAYAIQNGAFSEERAQAWAREQENLAKQGRFFFSITHFVCIAHRSMQPS